MPDGAIPTAAAEPFESGSSTGVGEPWFTRRSILLVLIATAGALAPLILLGVLSVTRAAEVVTGEITKRLQLTTALSGELLAEQIESMARLLEVSANRPRLVEAVADGDPANFDFDEVELQLISIMQSTEGLSATGLFDLEGVLRSSPDAPELVGTDFSHRPYYTGLTTTGETYVSQALESAQAGRPLIVTIVTYVRAHDGNGTPGEPLAILFIAVFLDHVQEFTDRVASLQGVMLWVADRQGNVLATPHGRPEELVDVSEFSISAADSVPTGEVSEIEADGEPLVVTRERIDTLGWSIYAAIPHEEAAAGPDRVRTTVLAIGIPLILVVCLGIALLVRYQREQWRTDAELKLARERADQANQQKSEFLSRMSHELRTPLNAVLGFAQVLELDELAPGQQDAVSHILKGGRHLLELVNEVLDISRIESGTLALSLEPVGVDQLVDEAIGLVRPLAGERSIELAVAQPHGGYVLADRQRLKQVMLNLLSNAIKYNRVGGLVIVTAGPGPEGAVRLEVSDTGPGVDPARISELFVPFERLGAEGTEVEGTGIGLALSHRLALAMGGTLDVESSPGEGSRFWIELPETEGPVERLTRVSGDRELLRPKAPPASVRRLLYVEDNLANLELVERVVAERDGIELIPTMQGSLAVELAREHRPALILLDLHLPDIPGEVVLTRLKADSGTREIPVIVVSADATAGRVDRLLSAGAVTYITKPIDVAVLLRILDQVFAP